MLCHSTKDKNRTPYFAFLDEFDDIVSDDMETHLSMIS